LTSFCHLELEAFGDTVFLNPIDEVGALVNNNWEVLEDNAGPS